MLMPKRNKQSIDIPAPDATHLATEQVDRIGQGQAQSVAKRHNSSEISSPEQPEQNDLKQDGLVQAPPAGMAPAVTIDGAVMNGQVRQEDGQQSAVGSAAMVTAQVESTAAHATYAEQIAPVAPAVNVGYVNTGHMTDTASQQSHVHIGQVNVVIEQAAAPRRRASAVTGNGDYASRNFLKSL